MTKPNGNYKPSATERFWSFVDTSGDCWLWTGTHNRAGYGHFKAGGRQHTATRWLWQTWFGEIPEGLFVLHHCDNPPCVNPEHLWLGSAQDNSNDMKAKGRHRVVRPENPYYPNGQRHGVAKLTDSQAQEIADRRRNGEISKALAAEFGVHCNTIYRIHSGRGWSKVVH